MFLIGGPAFSGTTLLALLLNQGNLVCLDEPDFHNPSQSHRGFASLRELFPEQTFPDRPEQPLGHADATRLIAECERAISPRELGIKTCDWTFTAYADEYRRLGHPVICMIRDIRDILVRPLPAWRTEQDLNLVHRMIWEQAPKMSLVIRYEDLVSDPGLVMGLVGATLGHPLRTMVQWPRESVHPEMLKLDRHELLKLGAISGSRVGLWKSSGRSFTPETQETARMMGY